MRSNLLLAMVFLSVVAACGGSSSPSPATNGQAGTGGNVGGGGGTNGGGGGAVPRTIAATSMDVDIPSSAPDSLNGTSTTLVRATVFIPEHLEGETYPLLLNSHGWGGNRTSRADVDAADPGTADSGENYFVLVERETETFWNAGYAVISFDERGFGRGDDGDNGTPDGAHGMSPDFEVKDASAIIDWAVANLDITMESAGDPLVGAFGGSYGGAFQLMLAATDSRVDAIIPSATWFDFELAILPNGVIKKAYGHGLCLAAVADMAQLAAETQTACNEGSTNLRTREIADTSAAGQKVFLENSLKTIASQPGFVMPAVDALLFQGSRDILFNLSQAVQSFEFLTAAGGDVRLLSHEDGHAIDLIRNGPGSQGPLGDGLCGNIDVVKSMLGWFDEKLRGMPSTSLPRVCISLDDFSAVRLNSIPRGNSNFRVTIGSPQTATGASHHNNSSPADQALFFPLANPISSDALVLAGVPTARLSVDAALGNVDPTPATGPDAAAFVGIGIRRNGMMLLVDDQVQPLRANDPRTGATPDQVELIAVGEKLQVGDEVGVLVFGRHDQYENHIATPPESGDNWIGNRVDISGTVDLPIFAAVTDDRPRPPAARELCVANDCGTKNTVGTVPDAENSVFADDGRFFVSGGEQVYEVKADGNGGFTLEVISSAACNFSGLEIIGNTLYANCFNAGQLWAGALSNPVQLNPIHSYNNADFPNGLESGPDGALYVVNGPRVTLTPVRIIRITLDPTDPFSVTSEADWFTGSFSPNGLSRIGHDFYFSETDMLGNGNLRKLPINPNGTAGTAVTLFSVPATVLDGVSSFGGNRLLVTSLSGGSVILADTEGNILGQTVSGGFESPSSARRGEPPLFDNATLLVTEKGNVGEGASNVGNRLTRFDP